MAGLIEHGNGNGSGNGALPTVQVGNSTQVSLKEYQDIYHQITGRTEQIRKRYSDNLRITISELEQLNYKITQLCDVHHVIASNETITIFHEKERKEQFTSFDRFTKYNANAVSPTVSVHLKYNFSIVLPGIEKPQEYVVAIRLTSRVALVKEMEEDAPPFMRGAMYGYLTRNTAEITVDYADYIVARAFIEAFNEWVEGCDKKPRLLWLEFLSRWSFTIPGALRLVTALGITYLALKAVPVFFVPGMDIDVAPRFFIIYSAGALVLIGSLFQAGRLIERAIDHYPTLSYLRLNKGDENLIAEFRSRRRLVVWKFVAGCALTILLGLATTKLEKFI